MQAVELKKGMGAIINDFCKMLTEEGMGGKTVTKQQALNLKLAIIASNKVAVEGAFWAGYWYATSIEAKQKIEGEQ